MPTRYYSKTKFKKKNFKKILKNYYKGDGPLLLVTVTTDTIMC